jgi:hypothetical protein
MKRSARLILAVLALDAAGVAAQDLEPRTYANAPVGMKGSTVPARTPIAYH